MQYRRAFVPGGTFFFTLVTADRKTLFADDKNVEILRKALRQVRSKRPFVLDAAVILPDHLHCIWTLPPGDADFATRWRLIKTWFAKHRDVDGASGYAALTRPTGSQSEHTVWQHRYWEHVLRDETDYRRHLEYIHFNPVKHGYIKAPIDWPYSSFRRYVNAGIYPPDWGGEVIEFEGVGRE